MVFNSYIFLIFFPVVVLIYHIIPNRFRKIWLLLSSYYFYMSWNVKYAILIFISTVVTYFTGILLQRVKILTNTKGSNKAKVIVGGCFCVNLGILFFFKYFNFFFSNISTVFSYIGLSIQLPSLDVILPVGISFYTFQALGYCMDVYKGNIEAEHNFFKYALFVSFFPQLVAGPIERSGNLLNQLSHFKPISYTRLRNGVFLMLWGYFQKIVIADRIAIFVDTVYSDIASFPGVYLMVASLLFAFQIYCDFGGYSNIAKGAAMVIGIDLMNNFESPYLSQSCGEFWKRWHISLSSWFRDYVYIPMGGNRKGLFRKYLNIIIVFGLSGLWHGANWTYVAWGLINGFFQILGDMLKHVKEAFGKIMRVHRNKCGTVIVKSLITFLLIDFSWIFFRATSISDAISIIQSIIHDINPWVLFDDSLYLCGLTYKEIEVLLLSIMVLMAVDVANYKGIIVREQIIKQDYWFRVVALVLSVCVILVFGIWGTGYESDAFLYFQF